MTKIILHIGLIKTGTTFLQSQVFSNLTDVNYLGNRKSFHSKFLISKIESYLISNEGISGNPYKPMVGLRYFDQFALAIDRIKQTHNNPKIICCFREPSSFIQSAYKQYLHEGGTLKFEEFFSPNEEGIVHPNDFLFSNFISYLQANFKDEDLFLYDFDDFISNKTDIIKRILTFIGSSHTFDKLNINPKKKSNPSVPYHLEATLIKANKLSNWYKQKTGKHLMVKLFGKVVNGRVVVQYILPKFLKSKQKRDMTSIKEYYTKDWQLCLSKMKPKD